MSQEILPKTGAFKCWVGPTPHRPGKQQLCSRSAVPAIVPSDPSRTRYRGGREPLSICVLPSPCPLMRFAKGVSHRCQMRGGAAYSFQLSLDSNPPCPPPSRKMSSNSSLSCQKIQDLPPRTCTSNNILHPPKHHKKHLPHQLISGLSSSYILSCMSHYLISAD